MYKTTQINSIIQVTKLAQHHPYILNFAVPLGFINKNYKAIKEICIKNRW